MKVSAILVNYNGGDDTLECLDSLQAQVGVNCRPLVVDNASRDGSAERIRNCCPDAQVIVNPNNRGFCGGNNVGIRAALEAGCDYLFLVNNDTILEPDCLQNLLQCAQSQPQAAILSPAMYYYADRTRPWFTGSSVHWKLGNVDHTHVDVRAEGIKTPFAIPWTTGCAMLIPSARMRELIGFDERFFCYFEDCDLSFRAQRSGYRCVLCPTAILYHKVGATANRNSLARHYYLRRNKLLVFARNTRGAARYELLARLTKRSLVAARQMRRAPTEGYDARTARSELLGVLDFYRRRFGPCRYVFP